MFGMQHANHFVFRNRQQSCGCDRGSYPNGLTCYASLDQKKSPGPRTATTASLPTGFTTDSFTPPSLDIQHKLCSLLTLHRISLPRELLPPAIRTDLVFTLARGFYICSLQRLAIDRTNRCNRRVRATGKFGG